ncbi:hypothetical protein OAF99_00465 [Akkermansiaceae bacterium]|nr:hypothetical protein [Akkermansiaceae bacterium]MDB4758793.1 hypothetical protein [Akkermansiaceae bacterium]
MKKTILLTLGLALTLASCSEDKETSTTESNDKGPLAGIVLSSAPDKPLDIAVLRKSGKPGETVTFTGEVIGSDPVFMDGRAIMIMGDPKKLTACNKKPGDECERPWDVCCDDPDVITASIVTVQVVDDAGKPVKAGLRGVGGVKELSTVTVTGEVAKGSNDSNMLINATGIFVHPQS